MSPSTSSLPQRRPTTGVRAGLLATLCGLLLAACASSADRADADPPEPALGFTFLVTGERGSEYDAEQLAEIGAGHFANMEVMKAAGRLLIAGPFFDPRPDLGELPAWRGIFVFASDDLEQIGGWTATDPGVAAGVFATDNYLVRGAPELAELPAREAAIRAERLAADPETPYDGFVGRAYTLVLHPDAAVLLEALGQGPGVHFAGGLVGAGPFDGHGLACLDAENPEAARLWLAARWPADRTGSISDLILAPLYASDRVASLGDAP